MYILHHYPDTASLAPRMLLLELGVPHECRLIDRVAGALDGPAYRALHPLGKIPAMETPDGPMFETAAMMLYLCDRHHALAPVPDAPERANFLKWLFFISTNIHPALLQVFYPERTAGPACADAVAAQAGSNLTQFLTIFEAMLQRDAPTWAAPQTPSMISFYLGMLLHWLGGLPAGAPGHFNAKAHPALYAMLTALESRPHVQTIAADENLGPTLFTNPS
jgi:glutathione S-transferase